MIYPRSLRLQKAALSALIFLIFLIACGCQQVPADTAPTEVPVTLPAPVKPLDSPERHKYFHKEDDSYFSLIDLGFSTPARLQEGGTCWLCAASTSMESCYRKATGQAISIDPMMLLQGIYLDPDHEGFYISEKADPIELGGWTWMVVEYAANGCGDYILADANDASGADIDTLKGLIRDYGGVCVDTNDSDIHFTATDNYQTFNDPKSDDFDHAVVLMGWDDNFPAEYFRPKASRNGAFLAQNSRGDKWGTGGCYWISYDSPFTSQTTLLLTDEYSRVEAFDGGKENTVSTGDTTIANVFSSQGTLAAVGTYTICPHQKFTVEVRSGAFGDILSTVDGQFDFPGYHTVKLPKPLELTDYTICIRFEGAAPVEGEDTDFDELVKYDVASQLGQSYVLIGGEWLDLADEATAAALGIDFIPNNACIKALYR